MTAEQVDELSREIRRLQTEVHELEKRRNTMVLALLNEGQTHQQISELTGLSRGRIGQIAATRHT